MDTNLRRSLGSVLIAIAAAVVVIAGTVLAFLNPVWVGFEQGRTRADAFTGFTLDDVHRVTNAVMGELILGPATFLQQVGGLDVFDARERQHLADVRGVLSGALAIVIVSLAVLVVAGLRTRDRRWLWHSVARGTSVLAGAVVIVGALFAVFFDAAFDLFHRLLFAGGSYDFDPAQERLVQLFPEAFWADTSIALAVLILFLAVGVTWFAARRAAAGAVPETTPLPAVTRQGNVA